MNFLMGQTYGLLFDLIKLDLNKRNKRKNMLFINKYIRKRDVYEKKIEV